MRRIAFGNVLLLGAVIAPAHAVVLRPGTPIVIADTEPAPVRRAVADLQRDLKKVLGVESPTLTSLPVSGNAPAILVVGPAAPWAQWGDQEVKGWESHSIAVRRNGPTPLGVLQGADTRGTICAVYEFSERFLRVSAAAFARVVEECDRILPKLPERGRPFFNDILRIQARYMLELNRTLNAATKAQRVLPNRQATRQHLVEARRHLAALREALRENEHGSFAGWYDRDRLFGMKPLEESMTAVIEALGRE